MTERPHDSTGRWARKLDEAAIAEALRRYVETDEHVNDIAAAFGVHRTVLLNNLRGRPGYAEAAAKRRTAVHTNPLWPARDGELTRLRAAGLTKQQIAEEMNVSQNAVRWRIRVLDLPRAVDAQTALRRAQAAAARAEREKQREAKRQAKLAAAAPPRMPVATSTARPPIPTAKPGTWLPPVGRTWDEITELALRHGRDLTSRHDLPGYNRFRVKVLGHAPLFILPTAPAPAPTRGRLEMRGVFA